jgi:hypothetical protein
LGTRHFLFFGNGGFATRSRFTGHLAPEPMMRARSIAIALTLCFVGAGVCCGQNAFRGTWKLKETKSEFSPGAPKNRTVVYETEGDKVKVTVDSVGGDGKPTHYV